MKRYGFYLLIGLTLLAVAGCTDDGSSESSSIPNAPPVMKSMQPPKHSKAMSSRPHYNRNSDEE